MNLKTTLVLVAVATSSLSMAQTMTPNWTEDVAFSGLSTPLRQLPRVYQQFIHQSQLVPDASQVFITGMQLRLAVGANSGATANWPANPITFSDFTITVGRASTTLVNDGEYLGLTPTFGSYLVNPQIVRTGALTVAAGAFGFNAASTPTSPNPWGPVFSFTAPYLYNQGETLVYTISHTGYGTAEPQVFFASRGFANNVTDAVSLTGAGGLTSAPNGFSDPLIVQFTTEAVPEPMTMSVLALGALAALRRRRNKKS